MTYTDGIHLVADSLVELHSFAKTIGLGRHRFHGTRKGHPHYDLRYGSAHDALVAGSMMVSKRILLGKSQALKTTNPAMRDRAY